MSDQWRKNISLYLKKRGKIKEKNIKNQEIKKRKIKKSKKKKNKEKKKNKKKIIWGLNTLWKIRK